MFILSGQIHQMEVSLALGMNVNFLIIMEIMVLVMLIVQANVLMKHTYPGLVMDYVMMVHGVCSLIAMNGIGMKAIALNITMLLKAIVIALNISLEVLDHF